MEIKKTARQLFQEHLSKDDFEKVLKYENEKFNYEFLDFGRALIGAFTWINTEEGAQYWDKIYTINKSLKNDDLEKLAKLNAAMFLIAAQKADDIKTAFEMIE